MFIVRHTPVASCFVGALILSAAWLVFGSDPRLLRIDWDNHEVVPFPVFASLEIGRSGVLIRRSSLSLVCGPMSTHAVLRSDLPLFDEGDWAGAKGLATIFVGGDIRQQLELQSELVHDGLIETLVTAPLEEQEVSRLSKWIAKGTGKISLMVLETGTFMRTVSDGGQIQAFASRCSSKRITPSSSAG
jgi:hypothetical protein